jgi:hypothetical protein
LLAITKDQHIHEHAYELSQQEDGGNKRSQFLAKWAREKFGLTASVSEGFDDRDVNKDNTPVRMRFIDIDCNDKHAVHEDGQNLLRFCQYHNCSGFCMKCSDKR